MLLHFAQWTEVAITHFDVTSLSQIKGILTTLAVWIIYLFCLLRSLPKCFSRCTLFSLFSLYHLCYSHLNKLNHCLSNSLRKYLTYCLVCLAGKSRDCSQQTNAGALDE